MWSNKAAGRMPRSRGDSAFASHLGDLDSSPNFMKLFAYGFLLFNYVFLNMFQEHKGCNQIMNMIVGF